MNQRRDIMLSDLQQAAAESCHRFTAAHQLILPAAGIVTSGCATELADSGFHSRGMPSTPPGNRLNWIHVPHRDNRLRGRSGTAEQHHDQRIGFLQ